MCKISRVCLIVRVTVEKRVLDDVAVMIPNILYGVGFFMLGRICLEADDVFVR